MLKDFTRQIDKEAKGREGDRIHVIFMVCEGNDYCRDQLTMLSAVTAEHTTCCAAAQRHFDLNADATAKRVVTGFRIERW